MTPRMNVAAVMALVCLAAIVPGIAATHFFVTIVEGDIKATRK